MKVYFKCSFKSSNGYRMCLYNINDGSLSYISEQDGCIRQKVSSCIAETLQTQLGRSMMLATDESGQLFVGIYGLVSGDYDKYVNAVFTSEDRVVVFKVFSYFCRNYKRANEMLLEVITRNNEIINELEYQVDNIKLSALMNEVCNKIENDDYPNVKKSTLIAFVSKDKYDDYKIGLKEIFDDSCLKCCNDVSDSSMEISILLGRQNKMETIGGRTMSKLTNVRALLVVGVILIILIKLIFYIIADKNEKTENSWSKIFQHEEVESVFNEVE